MAMDSGCLGVLVSLQRPLVATEYSSDVLCVLGIPGNVHGSSLKLE